MLRFEDREITLRLFSSRDAALKFPGAALAQPYAFGWLTKTAEDEWADAAGILPAGWAPDSSNMHS